MSALWVEGQVVQLSRRPGTQTAYLTLRDPDVDMSLNVTVRTTTLDAMAVPLTEGARVVVQAKATFWTKRGTLQLDARRGGPAAWVSCWPGWSTSNPASPPEASSGGGRRNP